MLLDRLAFRLSDLDPTEFATCVCNSICVEAKLGEQLLARTMLGELIRNA